MQSLLQNFICPLRDSHTARTSWSLKKRMDFFAVIFRLTFLYRHYFLFISPLVLLSI